MNTTNTSSSSETKNAYIAIIPKDFVTRIANSKAVSYNAIDCYLLRNKIRLRTKELGLFNSPLMVRHNIVSEEVDLLQGRVPSQSLSDTT